MREFFNLGELLKEVRLKKYHFSQAKFSELLGIDDRTYRRWENNYNKINDDNIEDLAEKTTIPFEVIFRLNHDYPTFYNIKTNRYTLCSFDRHYVNKKILQNELFDSNEIGNIIPLIKNTTFQRTKRLDFPAYPYKKNINSRTLDLIAHEFPDLNVMILDPKGFYSGHIVTIPLKIDTYRKLKSFEISEYQFKRKDVEKVVSHKPIALHILSFFAINTTYVYCLTKRIIHVLLCSVPDKIHESSILSRYVVTDDGAEFCRKFGMNFVDYGFEDYQKLKTEVIPHFFEIPINKITWLDNYRDKIGKIR